jgi:hypothetical protein
MKAMTVVPILGLLMGFVGCKAQQLQNDQDYIRQTVLQLQEDQLMDNLVRAQNGLPILHLDYSRMTGTVTLNANASLGGSQSAGSGIMNVIQWSTGASNQQVLTVTADPVLENNEVYDAYLQFIDDGHFKVTCDMPTCDMAHLVREYCGLYYWVPAVSAADFLRLSMVTSVQRGQPFDVREAFRTKVEAFVETPKRVDGQIYEGVVRLGQSIPNDQGFMTAILAGVERKLDVQFYDGEGAVERGERTDRLNVVFNLGELEMSLDEVVEALADADVEFHLDNHRVVVPTTEDLVESIRDDLHLLRVQSQSQ